MRGMTWFLAVFSSISMISLVFHSVEAKDAHDRVVNLVEAGIWFMVFLQSNQMFWK